MRVAVAAIRDREMHGLAAKSPYVLDLIDMHVSTAQAEGIPLRDALEGITLEMLASYADEVAAPR